MRLSRHGGFYHRTKVEIKWVNCEELVDQDVEQVFADVDGIMVPGGFGSRGIEGKIKAIEYALRNEVPFFGISLGMQCAVIEFARNVCGLKIRQ